MKTVLFSKNVPDKDALKRDIEKLLQFEIEKALKLPSVIVEYHAAETAKEENNVLKKATENLACIEADIKDRFSIINFFLSKLTPDEESYADSPQDIVNDLVELEILDADKKTQLKKVLAEIKKVAETYYYDTQLTREYSRGCFPTLKSFTSTVDYRAVFQQTFKHENIEEYIPKFLKMIPVASIRLRFSEDSNLDAVSFQLTPPHLDWLIDNLLALKKEISESQQKVLITGYGDIKNG